MRQQFPRKKDGSRSSRADEVATESDPLLSSEHLPPPEGVRRNAHHRGTIRSRRSSRSPAFDETAGRISDMSQDDKFSRTHQEGNYSSTDMSYELHTDFGSPPQHVSLTADAGGRAARGQAQPAQSVPHKRSGFYQRSANDNMYSNLPPEAGPPPLLEIPEEVYAVRKAALKVMKPLIASWLVITVGFAISLLLGMARWTNLMTDLPYWFILLPSWGSHVGLLMCHIKSARALSKFIAQANENRQRPDSTDISDRTEYLPLLQRSLKFGLKTGMLSFCIFIFEVLLYIRIARGSISLGVTFIPMWLLVGGAIFDGIVCKTQHFLRVLSTVLMFSTMILTVLRVDYGIEEIHWRLVISPVVTVLSISSATLIYIVYGHQVGYYRLTEAQLTAGILYSMSALICVVLVVMVGEVMPLARPVEIETRLFFVVMAPLVVCLTGMGAWAVSRDEFGRLLLYGGQSAVHPKKLRWEKNGWTSVQSKGVTVIPMFGEVSYCPLPDDTKPSCLEICPCCSCYPYAEVDELAANSQDKDSWLNHPYLVPPPARSVARTRRDSIENPIDGLLQQA